MRTTEPLKNILVFDPRFELCKYLGDFIPLLGNYQMIQASNSMEVLAKINAFEPSILIYDLSAEIDSARILNEILLKHPETKLIIITQDRGASERLKNEGRIVLLKPVDLSDLSQLVKKLLPREEPPQQKQYARLLVADDESEILEMMNDIFRPLGIEVLNASDGREALQVFEKQPCNLAIIDLTMPEVSGTEVIKSLQSSASPPKIVILITAALGKTIQDIQRQGYLVMPKPLGLEALEKKILETCHKYGLALQ